MTWLRISVYIFATLTCGLYAAMTLAMFLYTWADNRLRDRNPVHLAVPFGAFGVVVDTVLLFLPMPAVMTLHLPMRKKVGVVLTFMTGVLYVLSRFVWDG